MHTPCVTCLSVQDRRMIQQTYHSLPIRRMMVNLKHNHFASSLLHFSTYVCVCVAIVFIYKASKIHWLSITKSNKVVDVDFNIRCTSIWHFFPVCVCVWTQFAVVFSPKSFIRFRSHFFLFLFSFRLPLDLFIPSLCWLSLKIPFSQCIFSSTFFGGNNTFSLFTFASSGANGAYLTLKKFACFDRK